MSGEEFGQVCGSCGGSGVKLEQRLTIDEDGKSFTVPEVLPCRSCQGTGWLYGRNR